MPVVMKPEPQDQTVPPHPVQPPAVMPTSSAAVPISAPLPVTTNTITQQSIVENLEKLPEDMENRIDVESIKGVFGWATVDGVNVPYIIRKYKKFVSVRIVEKKLLSRYPNAFPDELAKKDPLVSFFVTEYEAKLLDEINTIHCSYEYGTQPFSTKELIVDLVEFEDFYNLVKKTFPEDVLAKMRSTEQPAESTTPENSINRENLEKMCAWIQINNTVTPVIRRNEFTFVPLSVIKYAAGLMKNVNLEGIQPSTDDCALLNETCKIAGFDFQFGPKTKLIELTEIVRHCQPTILQLPFDDPLKHARYLDTPSPSGQPPASPTTTPHSSPPTSMPNTQVPSQGHQYPYQRPNVPVNPFAMMQMMSRSLVPQQLAYSQPGLMPNAMANPAMVQRLYNQQPRPSSAGKPSHPLQMQQQMNAGKTPPYPPGYNPNLPPNHPANLAQARVNFPQDQVQVQKGIAQHPSRHNMPPDVFPPNQSYPGHNPRSLPPTPPYQSPMPSGRGGITSNAGNIGPHSSTTASSGIFSSRQSKPSASPNNQNSASQKTGNNHLKIEGVVINGKSISCLNVYRGAIQGKFCLVEAVCKLYFSQVNIQEFLFVLQNVFKVRLHTCMDDEEKAFIQYYNLPVNMLKCNKMVHLKDLEGLIPRMTYIINQRYAENQNKKELDEQKSNEKDLNSANGQFKGVNSRKRLSSGQGGPEKKQSSNLEQIMQRLSQKNQSADDSSSRSPSVPKTTESMKIPSGVIVLDD
ncbi:hypothetical protein LOTGIDRAFT_164924 [Lottia gigantea]|uniref:Uncharacterized protein n=1 Tax=Lottia gigantea TaxID=225164 RepID=V3ZYZ3_LOTGI|nr:hypothetical protein LOTGIDRAFT_164924 [Lottia gigantea]ESO89622.1 hypothetical protein LOTGIDRAFT_164924 [Lottia gigantea]